MQKQAQEEEDYLSEPLPKAKYSKTTMKKKEQLVEFVVNQHCSIYKASKKLKLSNSTAKSLLKNYEKYGTILDKFTKNRILKLEKDLEIKPAKDCQPNRVKEEAPSSPAEPAEDRSFPQQPPPQEYPLSQYAFSLYHYPYPYVFIYPQQ